MKFFKNIWKIPALLSFLFCSCSSPFPSLNFNDKTYLSDKVYQLSSSTLTNIQEMNSDSIVLSGASGEFSNLKYGDILVGNITPHSPNGFLRRFKGISTDGKIILTDNRVSLEEIADKYKFSSKDISLSKSKISNYALQNGVSKSGRAGRGFEYILDKEIDLDGDPNTYFDRINLKGAFNLESNFDIDFQVEQFKVTNFSISNYTSERLNLTASSSDSLSNIDYTIPIAEYSFNPIVFTIPGTVIPIYLRPELEISLNIQGSMSKVSATLNQSADFLSVLKYENNSWSKIFDSTKLFEYKLPSIPDASFSLSLEENLSISVYESISPHIKPRESLSFSLQSGNPAMWQLYGGFNLDFGIDMGIFSNYIDDYNKTFVNFSTLLASGSLGNSTPTPQPTRTPTPRLETIVLQPDSSEMNDAYVMLNTYSDGSHTSNGCGNCESLNVETYCFGSNSCTKYESFIQFPMNLSSNSKIQSATLSLYGQGDFTLRTSEVDVAMVTSPWNENYVEWDTKPSFAKILSTTNLSKEKQWWDFDITSAVQQWVDGTPNYGVALRTDYHRPVDPGFFSSDYPDSSLRPKITITYTK